MARTTLGVSGSAASLGFLERSSQKQQVLSPTKDSSPEEGLHPEWQGMRILDNSVPVVVLVSSQHGGVGIIRSLGRLGIPVYGIHQDSWEPAARSRFLKRAFRWDFSAASAAESVSFLLDVAQQIGNRPILLATSDVTALFVAENAEILSETYLVSTPTAEVTRRFLSKQHMHDLCRGAGIPTPQTALPRCRDEALRFAQLVKFPVIVKGEYGEFLHEPGAPSVRVAIVASEIELLKIFDLNAAHGPPTLILQEYIPGGDDTIWMFNGYFDSRSECLFGAAGKKLRQFPAHRGSTSLGICLPNSMVETQTKNLMRAVGYRGPLDVGYRFDARDGLYKLLDVNPRIGATMRLFVAGNALDVVRALYLDLTGQTIPHATVRQGRKWIVESNDLVSCGTYWREGQLGIAGWIDSLRGIEEGVWLAAGDLAPLASLPFLWLRRRFRKSAAASSARHPHTANVSTDCTDRGRTVHASRVQSQSEEE